MMLQWLTSSVQLLYCNFLNITLAEREINKYIRSDYLELATLLSIIGLYVFSMALYLGVKTLQFGDIDLALNRYSPRKVLTSYIIVSIVIYLTSVLIWSLPSLVQYFYFFFYIKWGFFVVTFYVIHKRALFLRLYFYGFIGFEVLLSLSSFFAQDFLNIVFFSTVGILVLQPKLNFRSYMFIGLVMVVLMHYLILWTAVKTEYRTYVTGGK